MKGFTTYADGQKFERLGYDWEKDHDSNTWEWIDVQPSSSDLEMLNAIIDSKESTIRFHGTQYRADFTVKADQKRALKSTLETYSLIADQVI